MLENIKFRVKYSDVKEDLTISWESLEDMLQEAAILDYDQYGYGIEGRKQNHTAFLLLYLKINMIELPKWNEMIAIRTWCNELDKIYCYRNYEIINNQKQVIGTAFNKLLVYDLENKRPKKIDEQLSNNLELYHKFIYDNHANKYNKIEHLEEQQTTNTEYFKIQKHDIDINGHVNNVKYIDFAQNTIEPINNAHNLDACYQKEITELNTIKCDTYKENKDWIVEIKSKEESKTHAIIKFY